jgi:hypothetical protein
MCKEKLNPRKISRQQRQNPRIISALKRYHFLLLELMIGLYLVSLCALPLAQLPMKALKETTQSAFRMQMHRFADLAFAQIKEKLYRQEISWKEILSPSHCPAILFDDIVTIAFDPLGSRNFHRKATVHSVGKKTMKGEEWRLMTFKITFKPQQKKYKLFFSKKGKKTSLCTFIYKVTVNRLNPAEQPLAEKENISR